MFPVTLPLQVFIQKNPYPKVFSALPTHNQRKTCIKHIFDLKNSEKNFFLPTYLLYFFSDRYRKQTINFFRPRPLVKVTAFHTINKI